MTQGSRGLKEHELCFWWRKERTGSVWAASGACSPLGDLLVTQLQLRLQVLLWEKRKEVSQLGTPVEERESPGWTHGDGRWAVRDRDVGSMKREIGGGD